MAIDVRMPKLSDNMEEGIIIRWMKAPGRPVAKGEPLAEVETDKADVELEASDSGVLREIKVPEGQSAAVGAVIAVLAAPDEASRRRRTGARVRQARTAQRNRRRAAGRRRPPRVGAPAALRERGGGAVAPGRRVAQASRSARARARPTRRAPEQSRARAAATGARPPASAPCAPRRSPGGSPTKPA